MANHKLLSYITEFRRKCCIWSCKNPIWRP